mmetsp:Transcript_39717/g.81076  ORF Transcript_39717/g.81076 Transcript_39717/m.81076 type:complete len:203 (+) Transcript_39717:368-976(+)
MDVEGTRNLLRGHLARRRLRLFLQPPRFLLRVLRCSRFREEAYRTPPPRLWSLHNLLARHGLGPFGKRVRGPRDRPAGTGPIGEAGRCVLLDEAVGGVGGRLREGGHRGQGRGVDGEQPRERRGPRGDRWGDGRERCRRRRTPQLRRKGEGRVPLQLRHRHELQKHHRRSPLRLLPARPPQGHLRRLRNPPLQPLRTRVRPQ